MSITRYDPFRDLKTLQDEVNRLFSTNFSRGFGDEGIARLADWAVEHAMGLAVAPPRAGRLPPPDRAGQEALQLAERVHRRLVAWRWMALRFPGTYRDIEGALAESGRLNEWIEAVLAARPSGRVFGATADAEAAGAGKGGGGRRGRGGPERAGAALRPPGKGRRTGRRRAGAGRPV